MMRKLLLTFFTLILLFNFCQRIKDPISPQPKPGSRNYVWKLDTLNMPMNYISSVWGAAPNDIWAIGSGGTYKDRLLHYDGINWSTYSKEAVLLCGFTIFGFNADNVWMGGGSEVSRSAAIWHYNGTVWSENYVYDVESSYIMEVYDIWGLNQNDIYACGSVGYNNDGIKDDSRGFLLHYDGKHWKESIRAQFNSQFVRVRGERNNVYVLSCVVKNYSLDGFEIYIFQKNRLAKVFSCKRTEIQAINMHKIGVKTYFVMDNDIFRYINGAFVKYLTIYDDDFASQINGRSEKDIFLKMIDGIAHYDGGDIKYLFNFPRNSFNYKGEAAIFEKEVFFPGFYRSENLLLHGRLNDMKEINSH